MTVWSDKATTYDVRFSTSPITEANWASASRAANEPTPSPAGTPETLTVAGLAEATTYYFALKTADEEGNLSALSNVAGNATASDSTPPATIKDLTATGGEEDGEIILSWTAPGDDDEVGTGLGLLREVLSAADYGGQLGLGFCCIRCALSGQRRQRRGYDCLGVDPGAVLLSGDPHGRRCPEPVRHLELRQC